MNQEKNGSVSCGYRMGPDPITLGKPCKFPEKDKRIRGSLVGASNGPLLFVGRTT